MRRCRPRLRALLLTIICGWLSMMVTYRLYKDLESNDFDEGTYPLINVYNERSNSDQGPIPWTQPSYFNKHSRMFRISPTDVCKSKRISILILVRSSTVNYFKRQAIRMTWGGRARRRYGHRIRVLFFVGETEKPNVQDIIEEESSHYGDIVQCSFADTFYNLTLKSLSMFEWKRENCPGVKFVLNADDDVYVNVSNLMEELDVFGERNSFVAGKLAHDEAPVREVNSKFYVPRFIYPQSKYPDFIIGNCCLFDDDAVLKLSVEARTRTLYFIQDVFITGLCRRTTNVEAINHPKFVNAASSKDEINSKELICVYNVKYDTDLYELHRLAI